MQCSFFFFPISCSPSKHEQTQMSNVVRQGSSSSFFFSLPWWSHRDAWCVFKCFIRLLVLKLVNRPAAEKHKRLSLEPASGLSVLGGWLYTKENIIMNIIIHLYSIISHFFPKTLRSGSGNRRHWRSLINLKVAENVNSTSGVLHLGSD